MEAHLPDVAAHWEREATDWIAWARTPGHDAYWYYNSAFFEEMVPAPGRATLEVGCGEGRVARDLVAGGHHVTGVDASPTLLRAAREADPESRYVMADGADLPFGDGTFDLVVAYNSLMDIDDMAGAVGESARVLAPGGRLCLSVTHPIMDAGTFAGDEADSPFVVTEPYFERRGFTVTAEWDGLSFTFSGWAVPLGEYARALEAAGFLIEALREPRPAAELIERDESLRRWARIPMFLWLRALRA